MTDLRHITASLKIITDFEARCLPSVDICEIVAVAEHRQIPAAQMLPGMPQRRVTRLARRWTLLLMRTRRRCSR